MLKTTASSEPVEPSFEIGRLAAPPASLGDSPITISDPSRIAIRSAQLSATSQAVCLTESIVTPLAATRGE